MVKDSKFMKIYNMVMEWKTNAEMLGGPFTYSANSISDENGSWPVLKDGQPVLDYMGEPCYWKVMAPADRAFDIITGQKIKPHSAVVLSYNRVPGNRGRVYVLRETYENAYANNDEATIAKLQSMGLKPGFNFGTSIAAEEIDDNCPTCNGTGYLKSHSDEPDQSCPRCNTAYPPELDEDEPEVYADNADVDDAVFYKDKSGLHLYDESKKK